MSTHNPECLETWIKIALVGRRGARIGLLRAADADADVVGQAGLAESSAPGYLAPQDRA